MGWLSAPSTRLSAAPRAVGYGDKAAAERGRDQLRRLYNTKRWLDPESGVRRRVITHDNTECQMRETLLIGECHAPNSSVVDQIKSHRGNLVLFWDEANLQALCKKCHDREKQRMDNAAALPGGAKVCNNNLADPTPLQFGDFLSHVRRNSSRKLPARSARRSDRPEPGNLGAARI